MLYFQHLESVRPHQATLESAEGSCCTIKTIETACKCNSYHIDKSVNLFSAQIDLHNESVAKWTQIELSDAIFSASGVCQTSPGYFGVGRGWSLEYWNAQDSLEERFVRLFLRIQLVRDSGLLDDVYQNVFSLISRRCWLAKRLRGSTRKFV